MWVAEWVGLCVYGGGGEGGCVEIIFFGHCEPYHSLLSTPMGVDYNVVIGFDMEVQPLVTHNAA